MSNPFIPRLEGKQLEKCIDLILKTSYANQYNITPQEIRNVEVAVEREGIGDKFFGTVDEHQIELTIQLMWEDIKLKDWLTQDQKEEQFKLLRMVKYRESMIESMIWYELRKRDWISLRNNPYATEDQRAILKPGAEFLCEVVRRIEHVKRVFEEWQGQ